jgi:hypothetical protein
MNPSEWIVLTSPVMGMLEFCCADHAIAVLQGRAASV